jgi:very-short-patch-repair endonuclease
MATYNEMILFARELRKNPTIAENILWKYLRNKQLKDFKFLRQHPIIISKNDGDFSFLVLDFYCCKACLAIELDGIIHDYRKKIDNEKDKDLNSLGIKVLRFKNEELNDIEKVLKTIELHLID